jgi:Skp family chaperone for outer membrane proteins
MKNNSIDIVLEKNQIFMGNTNIDITNNIIELINQKFKDNG